jgi:hypothetical protein
MELQVKVIVSLVVILLAIHQQTAEQLNLMKSHMIAFPHILYAKQYVQLLNVVKRSSFTCHPTAFIQLCY